MAARAKKKITTTTEEVDDDEVEAGGAEKLDDEVIRALTELEGSSDITWQVHRMGSVNPGYCRPPMTTPELTLENIARRHGPGHYRIKGVKSDGTYFKSATITIAEPNEPADKTDALLAALKGGGTDTNVLLAVLQMQSKASEAAQHSTAQIIAAALSRPERVEKEFPWKEIIAVAPLTLTALKDFFAKKDESGEAMDKFLKMLTIVEKLRGDDKKEGSSWPDIIRDALPALSGMVARGPAPNSAASHLSVRANSAPGTHVSLSAQSSGDVDHATAETPEAIAPTPEVMAMDFFKRKFEELLANAAENKDPELRAELFLDDLPSFIPDSLVSGMLEQPDWFEKICAFDARVANYRGWFTDLREFLLHALQNADQDELPSRNDVKPDAVQS